MIYGCLNVGDFRFICTIGFIVLFIAMISYVRTGFYPATGSQWATVCGTTIEPSVLLDYLLDPAQWVDRDQLDSFMREYHLSSDKTEFLNEKRKQHRAIDLV